MTAMPGWDGLLSDDDIWKVVLFIKNSSQMKDAPAQPAAQ
jgi:mono/diheme cytochrome c family protein